MNHLESSYNLKVLDSTLHSAYMGHKTVRIRGVPQNWEVGQLQSLVQERAGLESPVIKSLAVEISDQSATATVDFEVNSSIVQAEQASKIALPRASYNVRPESMKLDIDFFGITTLFRPPEEDHKIE